MPEFQRLYVDTTVLRESQWPRVSVRLANVFELTRNFGIAILFPEPVEMERREQWRRDVDLRIAKYSGALRELSRELGEISSHSPLEAAPALDELMTEYDHVAESAKEKWGITTTPMTARHVADLFPLAVRREPPFSETGKGIVGFQDAVVLFSILDDARSSGQTCCALISKDAIFPKTVVLAQQHGVTIHHFGELEDYWKVFGAEMGPAVVEWRTRDRGLAGQALDSRKYRIGGVLLATTTPESLSTFSERVLELRGAEVTDIVNVETPLLDWPNSPPPYQRQVGARVTVSFSVRVAFTVVAVESAYSSILWRISSDKYLDRPQLPPLPERPPERMRVSRTVDMSATGEFTGQGYELTDFQLVGVQRG